MYRFIIVWHSCLQPWGRTNRYTALKGSWKLFLMRQEHSSLLGKRSSIYLSDVVAWTDLWFYEADETRWFWSEETSAKAAAQAGQHKVAAHTPKYAWGC
jgi:hypothetical protein